MQKRISRADIVVGQGLPWDVFDKNNNLLLRKGFVIGSKEQAERLIEQGLFVDAETYKKTREASEACEAAEERPSVVMLLNDATQKMDKVARRFSAEPEECLQKVREARRCIGLACLYNRNVALASVILQHQGRYSVVHCIHTAIICQIMGLSSGKEEHEIDALVLAALTMNLSMMEFQDKLQTQSYPLTPEQRQAIEDHPVASVNLLKNAGVQDDLWLATVLQHHEHGDGSGYPMRKTLADILPTAQIVQLADLYSARLAKRSYRAEVQPNVALRDIFLERGKGIDPMMAAMFIKEIGIYPPGSLVRLGNGEIAIISQQTDKTNTPIAHSVLGPSGAPLALPIKRDTSLDIFCIKESLAWSRANFRIKMSAIWGKEGRE